MSDSVLPERAIPLSPSLAASIGLEEAILLQHLQFYASVCKPAGQIHDEPHSGAAFSNCSLELLVEQLPFWPAPTIKRILQTLVELGMLVLEQMPRAEQEIFHFRLDTGTAVKGNRSGPRTAVQHGANLGGARILPNWQPEKSLLEKLAQSGVPAKFSLGEVAEFVLYWQERNEISYSWSSKFMQHVTRRWQQQLQSSAEQDARLARLSGGANKGMHKGWRPSEDAIEILQRMGINLNFIDDAIPEFVLHWQEAGVEQKTWNSRFVTHIKRQWAKYTHAMANDTEPAPIEASWQPDQRVFDVLELANIDAAFATQLVPEFVMYWRDKNELHHSWNTKFLQYVKHQWARNYRMNSYGENKKLDGTGEKRRTRDRTIVEDLSDRSWASQESFSG
ncbi:MAG: DnaT-like ssDNA-binding domain-containing protein [Pseudomonadales bacterium]